MARQPRQPHLKVNKHGVWEIRWTTSGRSHRKSTRETEYDRAVSVLNAFLSKTATKARDEGTLDDLLTAYLEEHSLRRNVSDRQANAVKALSRHIGSMRVRAAIDPELGPEVIDTYLDKRMGLDGVTESTVRRELVVLKAALNHAHRRGRVSSVPYIPLPAHGTPRDVYLTRKERDAFMGWAVANDNLPEARFILLALYTGGRKSALRSLTWGQVDWTARTLDLQPPNAPRTKKRNPEVPLHPDLLEILRRWAGSGVVTDRICREFVSDDNINSTLDALAERYTPGKHVRAHTLRHTFATLLLQGGVGLWKVAGLLGDAPETVAKTYGHHCQDDLSEALKSL